jgi:hypothetical protein
MNNKEKKCDKCGKTVKTYTIKDGHHAYRCHPKCDDLAEKTKIEGSNENVEATSEKKTGMDNK